MIVVVHGSDIYQLYFICLYFLLALAESDRGHSGQSSSLQHGLNFTQSALRPEIARSHSQNQSPTANGYMQGHPSFQARQSETNFLGVDTASRGLSALDSQIGNGPDLHKKNLLRLESNESPVNYDFFGGQQQISGQLPGMIQSLPRQQSGMSDMQLLQQHAMLKHMQELHRQQLQKPQYQLPESRHLSPTNQGSAVAKQGSGSLSQAPINGVPVHDASNYSWQPEHMTPNANWLQHGASPAMQASSSGFMFSPEQGQVRLMGLVPQQVDQSFYGISSSGGRTNSYQYPVQMDKPLMHQGPASSNSFPGNQYAIFPDQVGLQDGTSVSRQGDQGKNMFGAAAGHGLNSGFHSENLQQMNIQPKNAVIHESHGRQEHPGPSETSLEKSVIQAAPSQNVATLDPTEEKILFGSDDNVWDIFGKSINAGPVLDGPDSFGALPSLQSGSWSALMQSAVAETSSNDLGVQDEWSGLGVQNSEPPSGNVQSSTFNVGSKQQSAWADNNLQTAATQNSKPFPMSTDANINLDFCSVPGVQQSGVQTSNEQSGRVQNDSSQRFVQQITEERSKWLDRSPLQKPVAESAPLFGNVAQSPDVQVNAKNISGHQQGIAVYNHPSQPYNKQNGWNFIESASHTGGAISKSQDTESSLQPSQKIDDRGAMYEERGHRSGVIQPVHDANTETGNVNSALGSPLINREGSDLNNVAAITDSSMARVIKDSSRQLPNSHNFNLWKSIDSKGNSGINKVPANYQQNQDKGPQTVDLSGNNCLDKGVSETNMLENPGVKETSNDSFRSNLSQHATSGGMRDHVWVDANDPRGGKQKSFGHISRKPSVTRKFQYHPMGDLDAEVEPSYGTKSVTHSQHVPQGLKGHEQGNFGQSKFTGHVSGESTETEKGRIPGILADEVPSKSSNPGAAPERSFSGFVPNKSVSMSQNMLELLQKVDQPREHGTATHLSSSERNQSSEMPDTETSDGSVGQFQHNRPSASQGFGLQLGPPSQRFPIPDRPYSSQGSPQGVNSVNTVHVPSEVGRMSHTWLGPTTSGQSSTLGDIRSNLSNVSGQISNKASQYNVLGNVSAGSNSDYSNLKGHLQGQHVAGVASEVTPNESPNAPFVGLASQSKQTEDSCERAQTSQLGRKSAPQMPKTAPDNDLAPSEASQPSGSNQNHARDPDQQFPVLEAMPASQPSAPESLQQGAFTKVLPNVWTRVSSPQHLVGAQSSRASQSLLKPHPQPNSERTLPGMKKVDDQIAWAGGSSQSEFSAGSAKPPSFVGEEQPAKAQQVLPENVASQNPATTQRDIEAFGRSLRPNNAVNQNYSLLHQVQAMKNSEIDPSNRSVKRFKGTDSGSDAPQISPQGAEQLSYGSDTMLRDAPVSRPLVPSGDSKMLSFSLNSGDNRETHLSSDDIVAFARSDSQHFPNGNNSAANLRGETSQISPQMAPSWFDRYGTFKNGQMLPIYDARKIAMMKTAEKPFIVGRPPSDSFHAFHSGEQVNAAADASQLDNARKSPNLMPIPEQISPQSLPPDITNKNLVAVKVKKRKSMTFEFLPWHREVAQSSQRPQNISMAEVDWAHAANRLVEKVEDEPETIEDWPLVLRSKRRLILTTQLMQQLLRAPPRFVLSLDASKNYETVAYFVARSVLGDACSTAYIPESHTAVPPDSGSTISAKLKMSEGNSKQSILKAAEEFITRAKKLESDLQRTASAVLKCSLSYSNTSKNVKLLVLWDSISLDKRASILDLRVECQDLEKFSVINRFAKFHGRGQTDGAESSSSSDAIANTQKFFPQRYVTALPMPRNLPDRVQCLSL
ncbi:hypothetical protein COLO4_37591 [Corchorus olitorius]|uniref:Uncharacterized protein n=1 Tax=Corchorus olitorius TaxID=93759 RepID=A0A1R3G0T9_9ROSI|nr:hypothetical protein COLO4_37591 [Corchorus olitorius]